MLRGLLTMDPPRHTKVRQSMNQAFANAIADAARVAQEVTDRALDDIPEGEFDLVGQFASRVSQGVFFGIVGIPESRQAQVDRLARTMLATFDRTRGGLQRLRFHKTGLSLALVLLGMLPGATWGRQRTLLHEMTGLLWRRRSASLTVSEATLTLLQFVLAGYLSTEFLLSTGIRNLLLDRRASWETLRADRGLMASAVEEMRRFDAPLGVIERFTARETVLADMRIPAGSFLMGMLGSANRDEAVFGSRADRFDIRRPPNASSMALGHGIHECIGKALQEVVAPIALEKLMRRFPDLALASQARPPWMSDPYFRSFSRLMVSTG